MKSQVRYFSVEILGSDIHFRIITLAEMRKFLYFTEIISEHKTEDYYNKKMRTRNGDTAPELFAK